jgi:hypothetical protein
VNMRCRAVLDWTEWFPAAQYIPNSLCSPGEGGGVGAGGGGYGQSFLNMKRIGGGGKMQESVGGGWSFLSLHTQIQAMYSSNITLLLLKYLLIYSKLCYEEFHMYSPNYAKYH